MSLFRNSLITSNPSYVPHDLQILVRTIGKIGDFQIANRFSLTHILNNNNENHKNSEKLTTIARKNAQINEKVVYTCEMKKKNTKSNAFTYRSKPLDGWFWIATICDC